MTRALCSIIALSLLAFASFSNDDTELVRRALCTEDEVVREIELRTVHGAADICDIIERTVGESIEERTLHPASARSEFCTARFEGTVRSLTDRGWRCSVERQESRQAKRTPMPAASELDAGESAQAWMTACRAAQTNKGVDAERLCRCAIEVMSEAGFEERDFEVLVSPYNEAGLNRPIHRAGLLYGVGMMAVDALARCDSP